MQVFKYASMKVCKCLISVQVCMYANMYASIQVCIYDVCKYASKEVYKYVTMLLCKYENIQVYKYSFMQGKAIQSYH